MSKPVAQKYNMAYLKLYHQRDYATINGIENKGELPRDDASINEVYGAENKGEMSRDDAAINGVDGTDNKSEMSRDGATISAVSDGPSSKISYFDTDKLQNDNSPSCNIIISIF